MGMGKSNCLFVCYLSMYLSIFFSNKVGLVSRFIAARCLVYYLTLLRGRRKIHFAFLASSFAEGGWKHNSQKHRFECQSNSAWRAVDSSAQGAVRHQHDDGARAVSSCLAYAQPCTQEGEQAFTCSFSAGRS